MVKVLNENPELDLIYSDEDKIDMDGNRSDQPLNQIGHLIYF